MQAKAIVSGVTYITLVAICLIWTGAANAGIPQSGNLVALWLFDEGKGNVAKDSSGNGNNGELMKGPKWVDGKFGKALLFDGADDYVEVQNSPEFDITKELTIAVWAKFEEYPSHEQLILDKGPAGGPSQYYLGFEPAEKAYFLNFNGQNWHAGDDFDSPAMSDTEWHHVAVTFDTAAGKIKSCVDSNCNEYKTNDSLMSKGDSTLVIGSARFLQNNPAYYFNGTIDELAVFDTVLNHGEIKMLMESSMAAVDAGGKIAATWAQLKR